MYFEHTDGTTGGCANLSQVLDFRQETNGTVKVCALSSLLLGCCLVILVVTVVVVAVVIAAIIVVVVFVVLVVVVVAVVIASFIVVGIFLPRKPRGLPHSGHSVSECGSPGKEMNTGRNKAEAIVSASFLR